MVNLAKHLNKNAEQGLKLKKCKFCGCKKSFFGKGASKYCKEHRKLFYRKNLYEKKKKNLSDDNLIIKHSHKESTTVYKNCEACMEQYEIKLLPNQFVYPKFCEEHRNVFRREQYLRMQNEKK
jgi:hypothetical protein